MSGGATERPATLDHLRSRKKPLTQSVTIVLDSEVAEQWDEANDALNNARNAIAVAERERAPRPRLAQLESDAADAEAKVEELRPIVREHSQDFRFRSIGRRAFEELIGQHPATAAQKAKALADNDPEPAWNGETFAPALVAASMIEPPATEAEVIDLWNDAAWSGPELLTLWAAALNVNNTRRVADLGNASGTTSN